MDNNQSKPPFPQRLARAGKRLARLLPTPGNVAFSVILIGTLLWAQTAGALPLPLGLKLPGGPSNATIAYQGRLADAGGTPLTGTFDMVFRIYDSTGAQTPLWEERWTGGSAVKVSDGLFNVMLGSLTPLSATTLANRDQLFLGITVAGDQEMTPRVQLGSVPFALQALTVANGSITTAKIADGAVTQAKLGADISLTPPDGSITSAKLADGSVTASKIADGAIPITKLGEQPYYFSAAMAVSSEWMADVIYNGNYARFCQAIGRTYVRADTLQAHYHVQRGNGYFYVGWYYAGRRYHSGDTFVWGNRDAASTYNVWKYNGGAGCCIGTHSDWTYERSAIIWCR